MKSIFQHIRLVAATAVLAATASCGSDYLDTYPTESISPATAYSTPDNVYNALNGIAKLMVTQYGPLYGQGFAGENAIIRLYENIPSQNFNYNVYAPGWAPLHNQAFHTNNSSIYNHFAWRYYYEMIVNANGIIENADATQGSEAARKFGKASALAFRAYAYEKLTTYYCKRWQDSQNGASRGLPLRLTTSSDSIPAATLAQTYDQIYKDCQEAVKLFEESGMDRKQGQVWIANKNVAHAIYARTALKRQDYATALAQAKLAREGYPLMDNKSYKAGFCQPTSEWILGSYGSSEENIWYWSFGVLGACNGYYADSQETGAGSIGHELIERIPNNDVRKQLFLTVDKFPALDVKNPDQVDQAYGYIATGETDPAARAEKFKQSAAAAAAYAAADSINKAMSTNGLGKAYGSGVYHLDGQYKFWVIDQPGVGYVPFIRSSEMVLIEAEANHFLGNDAAAQASLVELNATSGRNPQYTCNKTGADFFAELKDYREVELWGEGFAWGDYKRWNIPVSRKSFKQGGNANVAVAVTIAPEAANQWTWVFPRIETDYNSKVKSSEE